MSHIHERIPALSAKLTAQSDFANWCSAAETMLKYDKAMDIVNSSTPRGEEEPTNASGTLKEARAEEQAKCDQTKR